MSTTLRSHRQPHRHHTGANECRLLKQFIEIMKALNSSNSPEQMQPITTEQMKGFRDSVGQINRGFGNSEQQDAHELLVVLLEAFHDLAAAIGEPSLDPSSLFEIEISIGFECKQCGDRDVTTEHCHEMFLPVDEPTNIQKLIVSAVQSEKERTCSLCGNGTAMKSEKIARYPEVLLVVLKRHEQHRNTYKKVNSEVIPSFTLCLRALEELGEDLQSERNYQLSSLVGHVGTVPTCGHYIGYRKMRNSWIFTSDTHKTYLCFYSIIG